ncbi:probable mitochondrial import inner membrane translocase subunit TIM21 isoform X2 [Cucurbita maxima]|uniref:Mitochondrial import inner membrane translocase subunit Tim21 n=1 Tax=Cucurbita maxima TaxID=3661 RepID=A0A6J1JQI4_CUCMA|nr:probable mitochondrial import inner membrane translocase subunit TIM21 isoform X2 [Cucurbita maxima]
MANGLMKLAAFVPRSSLVHRQWHQSSSFSRLGVQEYLQVLLRNFSHSNYDPALVTKILIQCRRFSNLGFLKTMCNWCTEAWHCQAICWAALGANGMAVSSRLQAARGSVVNFSTLVVTNRCDTTAGVPCFARFMSSKSSEQRGQSSSQSKKEISTVEDPFDAPTYNIPEKPVTFAEGASYSFIILAGLGVAAAAGYAVFKELIFQPKEYKIFDKALKRIQDDSQVKVRIGSPITGYGQETRNRAARQCIPNRVWTDEDGVERVEVNFYIRGPHGGGKVSTEMFKDQVEKQWKFTYLIVEVKSSPPVQLILESYMPA